MIKLHNGTIRVLVEGLSRAEIVKYNETENNFLVSIDKLADIHGDETEEEALMRMLLRLFSQYIKVSRKLTQETLATVSDIDEPGRFADLIASHLTLKTKDKQEVLETIDVPVRDR